MQLLIPLFPWKMWSFISSAFCSFLTLIFHSPKLIYKKETTEDFDTLVNTGQNFTAITVFVCHRKLYNSITFLQAVIELNLFVLTGDKDNCMTPFCRGWWWDWSQQPPINRRCFKHFSPQCLLHFCAQRVSTFAGNVCHRESEYWPTVYMF